MGEVMGVNAFLRSVGAIIEQRMRTDVPPSKQEMVIWDWRTKDETEDLQLIPNTLFIRCMREFACYPLVASTMVVKTARHVPDAFMSAIRRI